MDDKHESSSSLSKPCRLFVLHKGDKVEEGRKEKWACGKWLLTPEDLWDSRSCIKKGNKVQKQCSNRAVGSGQDCARPGNETGFRLGYSTVFGMQGWVICFLNPWTDTSNLISREWQQVSAFKQCCRQWRWSKADAPMSIAATFGLSII